MRMHVRRSKRGRATHVGIGVGGLLILVLALPLDAAPPTSKKRPTSPVRPTASAVDKDQAPPDASAPAPEPEPDPPTIDVLQGLRTGQLSATAEGTGDGRITLSLTNRTKTKLRVVLPPSLIASSATGQMGMMGGMGGGMGMMGGGGMMMGGGGMMMGGGMGGGMGMMGGGMGGGRGGRMGGGGTMPASMGMMMLGRLIMTLVGDRDSWDMSSLMVGMMGMGGMGMMGGMMGGRGMMGGMGGGGFRSVPPTGLPQTTLQPQQVRHLPTNVVSLNGPDAEARPVVPAKGEKLRLSAIEQWTDDTRTRTALDRLARAKAPRTVAQMVFWYVTAGADWDDIGRLSQGWGNAHELALARRFVAGLEETKASPRQGDPGPLYWEIEAEGDQARGLADGLRALWGKFPVLGLTAKEGIPARPDGPALSCRIKVRGDVVEAKLAASHPSGSDWVARGEFRIKPSDWKPGPKDSQGETPAPTTEQEGERGAARLGDALAGGMLGRLLRVQLTRGPRVKGKETFRIKLVNESPMILNGLALGGSEVGDDHPPSVLAGLCVPPLKSLTVPASAEVVERLHLKDGARVLAADLSGL